MLARFTAEEGLVRAGLDELAARRFAPAWARATRPVTEASPDRAIAQVEWASCDPRTVHALALAVAQLAERAPSALLFEQLLRAWSELGQRAAYLDTLADTASVPKSRRGLITTEVGRMGVQRLASIASRQGPEARDAVRVLRAASLVAEPSATRRDAAAALQAVRAEALARFEARAAELEGVESPNAAEVSLFEEARDTDARLDDALYRRRVLAAFLPIAWRPYTARRWDDLRALLAPLDAIAERLAEEIEQDPDALAYRASVSQLFVFRAEMAATLAAQIALAERALRLCPTLRNARVVLAAHLAHRAERLLASDPQAARADVERALELDPHQRRALALRG